MVFVLETETRALAVHGDEAAAVQRYEGIDVEAAQYLFWSADGTPLVPFFTVPNKRGWFSIQSGTYHLVKATQKDHAKLLEALDDAVHLEPNSYFSSLIEIRAHIRQASTGT